MFTIYIDDSGTAREHKVAVAAGIIFPAKQIPRFESEWATFIDKENIGPDGFHASECLARNQHSAFADWEDERVRRVFARVRQITFKYSICGFSIAILKKDYDEIVTDDLRVAMGNSYYSWAAASLIGLAQDWATERKVPMEYVFDTADQKIEDEIESAFEFCESREPGTYDGNYSFRSRKKVPALQCADLLAWTGFQGWCGSRVQYPVTPIGEESVDAYLSAKNGKWWTLQSLNREGIELWVSQVRDSPRTQEIIDFKKARTEKKKRKAPW